MLIPSRIFSISKCADETTTRYALGGVRLEREPDGCPVAIATDGRRMLIVRWLEDDADKYPMPAESTARVANFETLVPKKAWDEAGKYPPKKTPKAILKNVLVEESSANGAVTLKATDLSGVKETRPLVPAGTFPRWRDVIPKYDASNSVTFTVTAEYLAELLQAMAKMADGDYLPQVDITIGVVNRDGAAKFSEKAIVLSLKKQGVEATGVLMPCAKQS